jgi:hypothetical protein
VAMIYGKHLTAVYWKRFHYKIMSFAEKNTKNLTCRWRSNQMF